MTPKPRVKRLYRVTARFRDRFIDEDGVTGIGYTRTWHYQDKRAAEHRARICREGLPGRPSHPEGLDSLPALPAAEWVLVEESDPVIWPSSISSK